MQAKTIQSALISVYHKEGLAPIVKKLHELGVKLYSTGGTYDFIRNMQLPVTAVDDVTGFPEIFGGRVKTLHPKVFGGILNRRDNPTDQQEKLQHHIPDIDLVIVDLYPFEATVASGAGEQDIIEKIDIGGISLIRAAAKNHADVVIISSRDQYDGFLALLNEKGGSTDIEDRKKLATYAFHISSHYDSAIYQWMAKDSTEKTAIKLSAGPEKSLRYGENPHQKGSFFGDFNSFFDQLAGKEISYNNLLDIDAAVQLVSEFGDKLVFGIFKHNNACGFASANSVKDAYLKAFEADTTSAFGGVLICNHEIDEDAAESMNSLFFEILIAPSFSSEALAKLTSKKNRILLRQKQQWNGQLQVRSILNGLLVQDYDRKTDSKDDLKVVTKRSPSLDEVNAMLFASAICKQTKSNTIVLATADRMISSGVGQTSRVDALEQAIQKANRMGLSLTGAVMASDAFFPFPDCVEIAYHAGIRAVIQPGGSVKDQASIDYCDSQNMAMVFTGFRHFKH